MFKQRILVQFSVRGDVRFVSHHDLMRVLGRAARRAGLPVAMSEGFNPRPRISLLLARGVGVASDAELDNARAIEVHRACGFTETCRAVHFMKPISSATTKQ